MILSFVFYIFYIRYLLLLILNTSAVYFPIIVCTMYIVIKFKLKINNTSLLYTKIIVP